MNLPSRYSPKGNLAQRVTTVVLRSVGSTLMIGLVAIAFLALREGVRRPDEFSLLARENIPFFFGIFTALTVWNWFRGSK